MDARIENPEQSCRHPQSRRGWHKEQGNARQHGAGKKIRTPAAEASPGAIAHRADDRLDDQSCERCCKPEYRKMIGICAELLVDAAHIAELQAPAELNTKKSETHVPDLPEAQAWFIHINRSCLVIYKNCC